MKLTFSGNEFTWNCCTGARGSAQQPECYDRVVATKTLLTVEQFEQLPEEDHYRYELDHGELIEVAGPNFEHNNIRGIIEHVFRSYLAKQRLGRVIAEQEFRLDGDTVRRPDVAFLSAETLARFDKTKSILEIVPDLVVEVVSPSDTA